MGFFRLTALALLFGFIFSCLPQGQDGYSDIRVDRGDEAYNELKDRDPDRKYVLDTKGTRRSGRACEDEDRDHECKDLCKEMYRRIGDRDDCEEQSVAQIEVLFDVYELLEEPDEDELDEIDAEDFDVYLNISISSLDDLVDDWNSRESREFLYWLINNEAAAKVFEKEDDDYKTFTAILKNIKNFSPDSETWEPFITKIEDGKLMEVAIDSGNEHVIEWFMDYIDDENNDCDDESVSRDCFAVYCKIGDGIDDDFMEDWLGFDNFESYIEDIIDDKINSADGTGDDANGSGWEYGDDDGEFEDIGDISDDWVGDLCQDLT